jgi:hypothetical protein
MAGEAEALSKILSTAGGKINPLSYAGAGVSMIAGLINMGKGKQAARMNVRPVLDQSGLYEDLLSMYEQQAMYGYDATTMQFLTEENQGALTGTLQAMLMAGASPNDVAGAYSGYANAMQKAAADSSDRRWQKVAALTGATDRLFQSQQQEFLYNQDAPYKDKAQAAAAQQNAGFQQFWGGLTSLMGTAQKATTASTSYADQIANQLEAIFGKKPGTNQEPEQGTTIVPGDTYDIIRPNKPMIGVG